MWHIFWRGYSRLRSGREHWAWMVVVEVRQGTLGGDTRGWGPAGNTGRGWSWLRSGREHWAGMVVVEVQQGTLGVDGRGWGPTENTVRRGSQLDEEDEEDDEEDEEDDEEEERRRRWGGEEEQATDIKSNNPHLAGGESFHHSWRIQLWDDWKQNAGWWRQYACQKWRCQCVLTVVLYDLTHELRNGWFSMVFLPWPKEDPQNFDWTPSLQCQVDRLLLKEMLKSWYSQPLSLSSHGPEMLPWEICWKAIKMEFLLTY